METSRRELCNDCSVKECRALKAITRRLRSYRNRESWTDYMPNTCSAFVPRPSFVLAGEITFNRFDD